MIRCNDMRQRPMCGDRTHQITASNR
jgi:hypothetical protein